jgi:hypothetical protein
MNVSSYVQQRKKKLISSIETSRTTVQIADLQEIEESSEELPV